MTRQKANVVLDRRWVARVALSLVDDDGDDWVEQQDGSHATERREAADQQTTSVAAVEARARRDQLSPVERQPVEPAAVPVVLIWQADVVHARQSAHALIKCDEQLQLGHEVERQKTEVGALQDDLELRLAPSRCGVARQGAAEDGTVAPVVRAVDALHLAHVEPHRRVDTDLALWPLVPVPAVAGAVDARVVATLAWRPEVVILGFAVVHVEREGREAPLALAQRNVARVGVGRTLGAGKACLAFQLRAHIERVREEAHNAAGTCKIVRVWKRSNRGVRGRAWAACVHTYVQGRAVGVHEPSCTCADGRHCFREKQSLWARGEGG
eukprot:6205166-Pleurochrysis_carterae.AAC.2